MNRRELAPLLRSALAPTLGAIVELVCAVNTRGHGTSIFAAFFAGVFALKAAIEIRAWLRWIRALRRIAELQAALEIQRALERAG